jgi:hypothetical protein
MWVNFTVGRVLHKRYLVQHLDTHHSPEEQAAFANEIAQRMNQPIEGL